MRVLLLLIITFGLQAQSVNALLGDTSWFASHRSWPDAQSPETERISTHLKYVLQQLRAKQDYTGDSLARAENLAHLEEYIASQSFPSNFSHADKRRPCFKDDDGRWCAVGYLILKTAGAAEAERINQKFRFHYLLDMEDAALLAWQKQSGLSLVELAMIQPSYGWDYKDPFHLYRSKRSGIYGLQRRSDGKLVIRARYDELRCDPSLPFVYGRIGADWHIFLGDGRRINRHNYSWVGFVRFQNSFRLVAADAESIQAFNDQGELLWENTQGYEVLGVLGFKQLKIASGESQGVLNARGEQVLNCIYDSLMPVNNLDNTLIAWRTLEYAKGYQEQRWGIIDTAGKRIAKAEYTTIEYYRGLYRCWQGRDQSLVNVRGESVVGWGLKSVGDGLCRYCIVIETEKGFGQYNAAAMAWDNPILFQEMSRVDAQYYRVKLDGKIGYMNVIGDMVIPAAYDEGYLLNERFFLKKDGSWCMWDYRGSREMIPPLYDTLGLLLQENLYNKEAFYLYGRQQGQLRVFASNGQDITAQYPWDDFTPLSPGLVRFRKGEREVIAQIHQEKIIYHPYLQIDYLRPIGNWRHVYGRNGKEGIWIERPTELVAEGHFRAAQFDTIIPAENRKSDKMLVRQGEAWGIYAVWADSMEIPCQFEDYYPKDRTKHSGWIYFKKGSEWKGYFYTDPRLQHLLPATQAKLHEWYAEENGLE